MRILLITGWLFYSVIVSAQTTDTELGKTIEAFHKALVDKNISSIGQFTDSELSYGHSNGWVETKVDMIRNLETGYMVYNQFRQDSLSVKQSGAVAHARFIADIIATRDGKEGVFHLKVLEIWIRKKDGWVLFARQAVKG